MSFTTSNELIARAGKIVVLPRKYWTFEFSTRSGSRHSNLLLFVAGLTDNICSVGYLPPLAEELDTIGWSTAQIMASSAGSGFGLVSLASDVQQISEVVSYFRDQGFNKIVLMGHSTGCQDCLAYQTPVLPSSKAADRAKLDGYILQAPVSDAEAISQELSQDLIDESIEVAKQLYTSESPLAIVPLKYSKNMFGSIPITALRWLALFQPRGMDDFFSTYLTEQDLQQTFANLNTSSLFLMSGADQFVPTTVDKHALLARWKQIAPVEHWSDMSTVISNATHSLNADKSDPPTADLIAIVKLYLQSL
ncbi:hypothetical protein CANCADRAFT_26030 [Tortispora caseinolytica NRRL Y-17796]|uniref:AB hydrolase-1 domain-containing protein n=1 Tax=Tortispora caseinolytica NRRL Y-17796 TaxID=767744 RepID=A0A1E4TFA6_9ASCO|nr:hypothetical protein CANCADRAFT_26030 [Tortispora caseinolytica NRRL Y-17796]